MSDAGFLAAIKQITEKNLSLLQVIETANVLSETRVDLAVQLYRIWISFNRDNPQGAIAQFNLAVLLARAGDITGARVILEDVLGGNPEFFPAYINLGTILEQTGQVNEAIAQWSNLAGRLGLITSVNIGYRITALNQMGRVLVAHQRLPQAEAMLRQSLEIDKTQREVLEHHFALRLGQCEWPVVEPWEGMDRETLLADVSPLSLSAYTDDPILQLATAHRYSLRSVGVPKVNLQAARPVVPGQGRGQGERLRIGYVSSDLRDHAIGYLMAEMFELHDRADFEIFVYYCGTPSKERLHLRIRQAVEHWTDITAMDDRTVALRIVEDGIDILVDVNGHTRDARTRVFAMQPAPIQVNWLGYPGTMGSPYHQYIIADDWIIPPEHEIYFTEKVVRLPCYQPSDRKRMVAAAPPTRAEIGLPDDAFVYCCFNGAQKISRFTFDRWMAILKRVPGSVLWLLSSNEATDTLLKAHAERRDVDSARLIFAPKRANPDHLARCSLADLFLDTVPYGAHTTANDALWQGVPILTVSGRGFASRVCGSLVRAAGLPDLVCGTVDDYVERAVALGHDRAAVQAYKERLAANRDSCTLFDMDRLVRSLEGLYRAMLDDVRHGRLPRPDLTNLDVYQQVGAAVDHDTVEVLTIPDYNDWYRRLLAQRHALWPIGSDRRLWTGADIAAAERPTAGA